MIYVYLLIGGIVGALLFNVIYAFIVWLLEDR